VGVVFPEKERYMLGMAPPRPDLLGMMICKLSYEFCGSLGHDQT
jgi:hypothetical protein